MTTIMKMGHVCKRGTVGGRISGREEGDKRGDREARRSEEYYIHMYEDSVMKPTKFCLKREEKGGELRNTMVGVNLFRLHSKHL
jgi:hypothetical protein